ncbi:hypothetical protein KJ693_07920 [bacterium]|nr:hypothetical protein [bacterium]MBU1615225.1 hypothetical protein [bacterium]
MKKRAIYGLMVLCSLGLLAAGCAKKGVLREESWSPGEIIEKPIRGEMPAWVDAGFIASNEAKEIGLPKGYVYFVNSTTADNQTAAQIGAEAMAGLDIAQSYTATITGTKAYKLAEATGAGTAQYIKGLSKVAAKMVNINTMTVRKRFPCTVMKRLEYPEVEHIGYKTYALLQMPEKEYKEGLKRAIESEKRRLSTEPSLAEVQEKLDIMDKIDKEVDEKFSGE